MYFSQTILHKQKHMELSNMYIQIQNFGHSSSIKSLFREGKYECIERIHQFPEIVYVIEGSIEITVDGVTETANAGDIAVITPFRAHSFYTPIHCKIWIGVVSRDFAAEFITGQSLLVSGTKAVFTPSRSLAAYVFDHLPTAFETQTSVELDQMLYRGIKALVYAILEEYTRTVPQTHTKLNNGALTSLLVYLEAHFKENVTLPEVAEALGYTPTYLSHCIVTIPNMNFRKLLNSLRIDYAKNLLISSDFKMIDIALECGFSNERSFYRAFSEITDMTPAEYRKLSR